MADKEKTMGILEDKIFILHGWTYAKSGFDPLSKWHTFSNVLRSRGKKVILLKVPGLTQNTDQIWTLDRYVSWLEKTLEKEHRRIILIGHSNGGRIASAYCAKNPGHVSQLVLIDTAGIVHNELKTMLKRLVFKNIAKIGKKISSSEKLKVILYKLAREGDYKNATEAQRQTMLNLIRLDLTPTFKRVSVPTLIIWGENDSITPIADGKLIHELIGNSKLIVIKSAKHSPQFTHPKEVAEKIVEGLA